jgi:branched-chain amino acid aminotransferase
METTLIKLKKTNGLIKDKPDLRNLEFGKLSTEHMVLAEFSNGYWQKPRLKGFQNLSLNPFTAGLHYGQTVFEGMKAFRTFDGKINIFRLMKHAERFNKSLNRMCIPEVPTDVFIKSIVSLVEADSDWVPSDPESSLYIRPFSFASGSKLGVKISDEYIFMVVASPSGRYHSSPLRVKVETEYVRAFEGGTGTAKCGGNYGGSYYATEKAKKEGFDQILWTDAINHEYIEESGMMNVGFIIDNKFITPPLTSTILDGVTRDSMLKLAPEIGLEVEERKISYKELFDYSLKGKRIEAFGIGTAAVVSQIKEIVANNQSIKCYIEEDSEILKLKQMIYEIRVGIKPDKYNWNYTVKV